MIDVGRLRAVAHKLIEENGRQVILSKRDRSPNDNNKPWRGPADPGTDSTISLKAAFYSEEDMNEILNLVKREGTSVIVAASDVEASSSDQDIEDYDRILDGSTVWTIEKVIPLKPGSTAIAYIFNVKE